MPGVNLRLTDEQHEQLRAWAAASERSVQREIIFRLFRVAEGAPPPDVLDHFKPDPKPTKTEKRARR